MPITELVGLKHIIYMALLSNITSGVLDDERFAFSVLSEEDVYDYFSEWDSDKIYEALNELGNEGLIEFYEGKILLGEFRGRRFFPFEVKSSIFDLSKEFLSEKLSAYTKSARNKSRAKYVRKEINNMVERVQKLTPGDFTELHGLLYEVYTGGEVYNIRNKVEFYQTSNILKVYDRHTTFAIIVEGTLNFDAYKKKGVPTLTLVAVMKDEIFGALTKGISHGKDYMRVKDSAIDDDGTF
jgi:hypothetical protein